MRDKITKIQDLKKCSHTQGDKWVIYILVYCDILQYFHARLGSKYVYDYVTLIMGLFIKDV
jgi:hypothetical protein